MSFRCAAANMVSLPLQPLTLHIATRPDAVNNMSNGRQVRFPLLLKVIDEMVTVSVIISFFPVKLPVFPVPFRFFPQTVTLAPPTILLDFSGFS